MPRDVPRFNSAEAVPARNSQLRELPEADLSFPI